MTEAPLDGCLACELVARGHTAAAAQALARKDLDAALQYLEKALILYEVTPISAKNENSHFQLLARLLEICRLLCHKRRPDKLNDALRLIKRFEQIAYGTMQ